MRLRSKLILAFLLLSVLPLAGMTVYGYRSSLQAFRDAVEAEADAMTAEMSQRMETVTADLGSRFQKLDSLPYEALLAENSDPRQSDPKAAMFMRTLKERFGDAAPLIERLKYTPVPPRPPRPPEHAAGITAAPEAPSATTMASADSQVRIEIESDDGVESEPYVIHLNRLLFDSQAPADGEDAARVIKSGKEWVVMPAEVREVTSRVVPEIIESIMVFVDDEDDEQILEDVAEALRGAVIEHEVVAEKRSQEAARKTVEAEAKKAELKAAFEQTANHFAEKFGKVMESWTGDPGELERRMKSMGLDEDIRGLAGAAVKRLPKFEFMRKYECAIEKEGKTVGHVEAQLDVGEVLATVLSETRTEQGEIPFAVGPDGSVFTPDAENQAELEELGLAALANSGRAMRPTQLGDNWIVQTRQVPEMDLVFGIARPVGESLETIRRTAGRNMGIGLGIVLVAMLGIIPLSERMTRNLSSLTEGAERLARGDLDARVPVRSSDEFGALARTFNRMGADLQANQRQLLHQERLKKELEMCRQIQDEMLPRGRSSFPFAEVRAVSIPAREVGGDFFNYFALPNGDVALLMGDVSGKGVPAALMMANLQATLKARLPLEDDLATLAAALDKEIEAGTPTEAYVTLFMAVIDAERGVLRYVNAGHNTQYLLGAKGGPHQLASNGRPLGLISGGRYEQAEAPLNAGDLLFLFTDGLIEAEDESGAQFGMERLEELLLKNQSDPPEAILERVETTLRTHRGKAEPSDDATLLVLRYGPEGRAEVADA